MLKWDFSLTKNEVGFFFFRMMKMGSAEAQRAVLKWDFSLTKNEVGFFTRDKFDLGKVTYAPEYASTAV